MREAATTQAAWVVTAAPSVRTQVQVKLATVAEALATLATNVERLACVGPPVSTQVGSLCAALATLQAAETGVATMGAFMPQQHCAVAEALSTLAARVGSAHRHRA